MNIIFLGTPEFALTQLEAIHNSKHNILAVVTQPDKVNSRGKSVKFSPVKQFAIANNLPLFQFEKISKEYEALKKFNAEIMVTAAYGQILSKEVLSLTPNGVINVHASLLPKYRGASPVQCALINGEETIGVSIMKTELSVDSGDVILAKKLTLNGDENTFEALEKLAVLGAEAIVETLDNYQNNCVKFTPQNHNEATFCKKILKEDSLIYFNQDRKTLLNYIRGMNPNPSVYTNTKYGRLKILKAEIDTLGILNDENGNLISHNFEAGQIVKADKKGVYVMAKDLPLKLITVQGEGGKAMKAEDYFRGHPFQIGEFLK